MQTSRLSSIAVAAVFAGHAAATAETIAPPAAANCRDDAIIVFDASGSMAEVTETGKTRIELARQAARQVIPHAARSRNLGLSIYGPGTQPRCQKFELKVPPRPDAGADILAAIEATETAGETPLTSAVQAAAEALDYTRKPAVVVLVTDGNENCGRFPCPLAHQLKSSAFRLTVHVIAYRINPRSYRQLSCLARETGGMLVPANTLEDLVTALNQTLTCQQITTAQEPSDLRAASPR